VTSTPPSPARTKRLTREETRGRLLAAAAAVFSERGIGAASIEEISAAAGLSRGAFYSNFVDIDELTMALLSSITDEAIGDIDRLLVTHPNPIDYLRATQELYRSPERRLRTYDPVLSVELVLYSLRNPAARPLLLDRLNRAEAAVIRIVESMAASRGLAPAENRQAIAAMISAMDDGFALHAIIDPTRDPIAALNSALEFLSEAGAAIAAPRA
jgi:AcrR family transcriptional regulator